MYACVRACTYVSEYYSGLPLFLTKMILYFLFNYLSFDYLA